MESEQGGQECGAQSAAQQEGDVAVVGLQKRPIVGHAAATVGRSGRVEDEEIRTVKKALRFFREIRRDSHSFQDEQTLALQFAAEFGRDVAVELHSVQGELLHTTFHLFRLRLHENPDAGNGRGRQERGHFRHESRRAGVENESHHVNAAGGDVSDVGFVAHSAHFKEGLFH